MIYRALGNIALVFSAILVLIVLTQHQQVGNRSSLVQWSRPGDRGISIALAPRLILQKTLFLTTRSIDTETASLAEDENYT